MCGFVWQHRDPCGPENMYLPYFRFWGGRVDRVFDAFINILASVYYIYEGEDPLHSACLSSNCSAATLRFYKWTTLSVIVSDQYVVKIHKLEKTCTEEYLLIKCTKVLISICLIKGDSCSFWSFVTCKTLRPLIIKTSTQHAEKCWAFSSLIENCLTLSLSIAFLGCFADKGHKRKMKSSKIHVEILFRVKAIHGLFKFFTLIFSFCFATNSQ